MKAVLPVAGSGTRMYPLGVTTPKCLIPIINKPLLVWSLEALWQNHIDTVVVVISAGKFGQLIREFIEQELPKFSSIQGLKIELAVQEQQLGTAHVLQAAKDHFQSGEEFIFMYGDDLYGPKNFAEIMKVEGLAVTGFQVPDPEKWGIFQTNEAGNLVKVVEKPEEYIGNLANIGCMKLDTRAFDLFDQLKVTKRGEYEVTDTLQLLSAQSPIKVLPSSDYWIPIGYPWHILNAAETFLPKISSAIEGKVEDNVVIEGKLILPKSSTIKSGTRIEGNVIVGENVVIGPNAYLRQNVAIGDNSYVGFSVELKNCIVGHDTRIPHLSYLGDSIVGNHVNVAGGCMATNWRHDLQTIKTPIKGEMVDTLRTKFGAVIGDGVKLGVNTTIYPGRKIWPNLTTLPGQVVDKDLTD